MSKSDTFSRANALQLACALARSGDGLSHDTAEMVVAAAKRFDDYVSIDPAVEPVADQPPQVNMELKMATTENGKSYAAGFALGSGNAEAEQICPHCQALDAALIAAGLPTLHANVINLALPEGVEKILLEVGINTLDDLIHAGPQIVMMLPEADLPAFADFMNPIITVLEQQQKLSADKDAPLSALAPSEYSGFPLNHFENLTPATVLALNQIGAVTIGDVTNSPQILASLMFKDSLAPGQLTNLLRHVVTNLTHNAADPSLSKERQQGATEQIANLSTAINALEQINTFKRSAENGRAGDVGAVIASLRAVPGFGDMLRKAVVRLGEVAHEQSGGRIMSFEQFVETLKQAGENEKPPTKH